MKRRAKALVVASTLLACLALGAGEALAAPPIVNVKAPSEIGFVSAKAEGEVNPGNVETSYRFDYVSQEKFEASQWAEASQAGSNGFPEGINALTAVQPAFLEGLSAETTYHLRLVAENSGGTETDATTFTTGAATAPTLALDPPEGVSFTKAHIAGTVDPEGGNVDPHAGTLAIHWELQYSADPINQGWAPAAMGDLTGAEAKASGAIDVPATPVEVTGLASNTEYKVRLIATYAGQTEITPEGSFETQAVTAPIVTTDDASAVSADSAHFSGTVDPGNADPAFDSSCTFRYVSDSQFLIDGFASAKQVSCDVNPVLGTGATPVKAAVTDLKPNTVYHLQLIAQNQGGTTALPATTTFTTTAVVPTIAPYVSTPTGEGAVTIRSALDLQGSKAIDCHFEYGTTTAYGSAAPCEGHPGNETQLLKVAALRGQFRLSFKGQETTDLPLGSSAEEVGAALLALPAIDPPDLALSGGPGSAGADKRYRISFQGQYADTDVAELTAQYGTEPLCSNPSPLPCDSSGVDLAVSTAIPGGLNVPTAVSAHLSGLTPGATYHFRLSADNGVGPAVLGADQTVVVPDAPTEEECPNADKPGAGFLPDCRAWEMVSPPEKYGGDVMADPSRVRTAEDGSAVAFSSLTPFADVSGTGVSVDYVAERSDALEPADNGWSTHAITPKQDPIPLVPIVGFDPLYIGDFSPDLSTGVFKAWSPVTENSDVAGVANLYLRNDLRSAGAGGYQLITACPLCAEPGHQALPPLPEAGANLLAPFYVGASTDFQHLAFESQLNLTKDAPNQPGLCITLSPFFCEPRLYESDHGALRLAGRIPAGSAISCDDQGGPACEPAQVSIAGQGAGALSGGSVSLRPLHIVSTDGSHVFFTVPTNEAGSIARGEYQGNLYARIDDSTTVKLNASERTDCAGDPTCGGDGVPDPAPDDFRPAAYWTASADGSRAFFTTTEALTDDAAVTQLTGDQRLYMYDTTKPPSDPHNLTYISTDHEKGELSNDVQGVIGASEDGSYVYFTSTGQLVANQPPLGGRRGVFVWHDGDVAFVARILDSDNRDLVSTGTNYVLRFTQARMTPDGRHLLLSTRDGSALPENYERAGHREFYLYSADADELTCVSCNLTGVPPTGDASTTVRSGKGGASNLSWHLSRATSDDGRYVFFSSEDALVSADTNGKSDVYEYDNRTAALQLISTGTDSGDSYFLETTPDGKDVFFLTREQLSGWDTDTSLDVYDARVDGGFPEPVSGTAPCSGDSCRDGAVPAAPSAAAVASAALAGPGNAKRRACPKGRRRVKTHCVKTKHRDRHHKRTASNRRAGK